MLKTEGKVERGGNIYNLDLQLELTDYCSLRCVFCNSRGLPPHFHRQGFLSLKFLVEFLEKLEKKASDFKRITFQINWSGESLLHPRFLEIVELLLSQKFISKIELHTNGLNWNFKQIDKFLDILNCFTSPPFFQITFSLDAFTEKTYLSLRKRGDFKRSLENFYYLWWKREKKKYYFPRIVWQFLVREENYLELKERIIPFQKKIKAKKIIFFPYERPLETLVAEDVIYLSLCLPKTNKNYQLWQKLKKQFSNIQEGDFKQLSRQLRHTRKNICFHPWENPVISCRGWITYCVGDEKFELMRENLLKKDFYSVWYNKNMKERRERYVKQRELPFLCQRCLYEDKGYYEN